MDKEFDFDRIGKKVPYRTPEHFFEEMQQEVMQRTYGAQPVQHRPKMHGRHRLKVLFSATVAAAAMLAGIVFALSYFRTDNAVESTSDMLVAEMGGSEAMDKWIYELSDEELEELVNFSENDIFLN